MSSKPKQMNHRQAGSSASRIVAGPGAGHRTDRRRRPVGLLELLEDRKLLAGDLLAPPLPPEQAVGAVHGRKWEDLNGDGVASFDEPGLAGVRVYADLNRNGHLDRGEPTTLTRRDQPDTDFDETGEYTLEQVPAGPQWIGEVVPGGFVQTFPGSITLDPAEVDPPPGDDMTHVEPPRLDLPLEPGVEHEVDVSIAILPYCIIAVELDVVSSDPAVKVTNLSGTQLNGCGGDVSRFHVAISAERPVSAFKLIFIDARSGSQYGAIPVFDATGPQLPGVHEVHVPAGGSVVDVNFGNQRLPVRGVAGRKWLDRDGDGQQDGDEPGLGGVTIYADLNRDGRLDRREPQTVTSYDNPVTDFDEGGLYQLTGLDAGEYLIRELVPRDYVQTFPGAGGVVIDSQTSALNPGAAIDLDVTDVKAFVSDAAIPNPVSADIELTVVWPDSCGELNKASQSVTVVGDHIVIGLEGHQVGNVCLDVISPETAVVHVEGLRIGAYDVVVVLNETLRDGGGELATLTAVGRIDVGGPGGHWVALDGVSAVDGIDFGNQSTLKPGSISGIKWLDANGNGRRDLGEPGLAGVTIYVDLNGNGLREADEPSAVSQAEDPNTRFEELGRYAIDGLSPGGYLVREVVPEGYQQTFPPELVIDVFPLDPGPTGELVVAPWWGASGRFHSVVVGSGQVVPEVDFGNQPRSASGGVAGTTWVDENGNGRRESDELGLAGVVVYADLNRNHRLDPQEPRTRTRRDDPETPRDETGTYLLSGLEEGVYLIQQIVPFEYQQTFPLGDSPIIESSSHDLPGGRAMSFELVAAAGSVFDGVPGGELTFEVVWPDGCGTVLADSVHAEVVGDSIVVGMTGTQVGEVCTLALEHETVTVRIPEPPGETYAVRATLYESRTPTAPSVASFVVRGLVSSGQRAGHEVKVTANQLATEIHFGVKQRSEFPPPGTDGHGDLDGNGHLDALDIELMAAALRAGSGANQDLSGDGVVDQADLAYLVEGLMQSQFGDANLDGRFDSSDLVQVFQAGEYEDDAAGNSTWNEGDWNGDGEFDTSDLVFAFQHGSYEGGVAARAADAVWGLSSGKKQR